MCVCDMKILVTGGAGFIGSAFIRYVLQNKLGSVINVDKLTYAGSLTRLESVHSHSEYTFRQMDIHDRISMEHIFSYYQPQIVINFAAETHVDRSIDEPADFIRTNIVGTYTLLDVATSYYSCLPIDAQRKFRFIQVSTDEVFGDMEAPGRLAKEDDAYRPSSPYAASKASADHLVMAWHRTYGLPTIITYCSNNYGPFQFPEKLVPLVILNALESKPLPLYGDGQQVRDWIYVDDHVRALWLVALRGQIGETYNISSNTQVRNIDLVGLICEQLQKATGSNQDYKSLITFVPDRPGHDRCYGLDSSKIRRELGWQPLERLETGLYKTVQWYIINQHRYKSYQRERLGLRGL